VAGLKGRSKTLKKKKNRKMSEASQMQKLGD
jgi:hypothetical protein